MDGETELYRQLHKLSAVKSEEDLEQILTLLWKSRKTGLSAADKSAVQSLLCLPSLNDVYPVLACLRSFLRQWLVENCAENKTLKLFPSDLPPKLQDMLIMSLQKCKSQWTTESSGDLAIVQGQYKPVNPFGIFPAPEISPSLWSEQNDSVSHFNNYCTSGSTQIASETSISHISSVPSQNDIGLDDTLNRLPRLKSMTWTLENHNMVAAKRVAIITLKLQEGTKSPLGETEVKFQVTRDKLDAMLRSMAYISDRLSRSVKSSEPLQKKQRQQ